MRERKGKSKGEQTLAKFNKAHRPSQAKCRLVTNQLYCVRSVLTTSVKILPYSPPLRLIKANKYIFTHRIQVGRKRKVLTKTTEKKSKQTKWEKTSSLVTNQVIEFSST